MQAIAASTAAFASLVPVFATSLLTNGNIESVTFNNQMTFGGMISKFAGLALGVIAAIGFIMLIIGAGMYAFAQNSEDGSMQIRGTRMAIAGMIALGISGILVLMGLVNIGGSSSSSSTSSNDVYTSE